MVKKIEKKRIVDFKRHCLKNMSLLWELRALCLQVSAHLDRRITGEKAIVGYLKYVRNQLLFVMPTGCTSTGGGI